MHRYIKAYNIQERYIVENQKLFRVSRLEDHNLDSEVEDKS